jgi:hypothetical protein
MSMLGKGLIVIGLVMAFLGVVFLFAEKIPFVGKLPGDFAFQVGNVKVFAPLATCLILSLIISLIFNLVFGHK